MRINGQRLCFSEQFHDTELFGFPEVLFFHLKRYRKCWANKTEVGPKNVEVGQQATTRNTFIPDRDFFWFFA